MSGTASGQSDCAWRRGSGSDNGIWSHHLDRVRAAFSIGTLGPPMVGTIGTSAGREPASRRVTPPIARYHHDRITVRGFGLNNEGSGYDTDVGEPCGLGELDAPGSAMSNLC